jgi:hypothetical protein
MKKSGKAFKSIYSTVRVIYGEITRLRFALVFTILKFDMSSIKLIIFEKYMSSYSVNILVFLKMFTNDMLMVKALTIKIV